MEEEQVGEVEKYLTSETLDENSKPLFYISQQTFVKIQEKLQISKEQLYSLICTKISLRFTVSPISHFSAGAIVVGEKGDLYLGTNVEFPGYDLNNSIHAEQFAISNALLSGETKMQSMVTSPFPCGHCRQFIRECNITDNFNVVVANKETREVIFNSVLADLLPFSFSPKDLNANQYVLESNQINFSSINEDIINDEEVQKSVKVAQDHLKRSHAPYTKVYASVVIHTTSEQYGTLHHPGVYLENAAFNPSLSPFQCAITSLVRSGEQMKSIDYVVCLQAASSSVSFHENIKQLLSSISPRAPVHVYTVNIIN